MAELIGIRNEGFLMSLGRPDIVAVHLRTDASAIVSLCGAVHFFKESVVIKRQILIPWRFSVESREYPGVGGATYRGTITSRPPFLYCESFEPIFHDRTSEILRRVLEADALVGAEMFVGIHFGRGYEQSIHAACDVLLTRKELDPISSPARLADPGVERMKFFEIVQPYFEIDAPTFQLLLR